MEVALGVGSLVLLAGGLAAVVRRPMRPRQAVALVAIADIDLTSAVEGDGVRIQTCINAAAGSCTIDH